jgi:Regulator of volume decrease after cellular swelling
MDHHEMSHDDTTGLDVVMMNHGNVHPDDWPHVVLRGSSADLAALRHEGTYSTFFTGPRELILVPHQQQVGDDGIGGSPGIRCRVKWRYGDQEEDEESEGDLFITVSQVLFGSSSSTTTTTSSSEEEAEMDKDDVSSDWAIGATCIHLHAMADEPEPSIYLQVTSSSSSSSSDNNEEGEDSMEVTIIPLDPNDCQTVFDGLCKLVAKHPLQLDDDDDGPGFGGGHGFDLDDMIWAPSAAAGMRSMGLSDENVDQEEGNDAGASESEREAMLHRLDNMLVVLPEFQVRAGQFDDADEVESEGEPQ